MTKIYVGNLPFSATDAEIRELFAAHGTVESVVSGSLRCRAPMRRARSRISTARSSAGVRCG